ncbi:hypothetical protein PO124_22215 [Bacillus licheniformis]|nr:hypothetical protein [Bacillus licheniformis]
MTEQLHQINGRVQAGLDRLQIEEYDILNADTTYEYEWKLQETVQAYIELRELKRSLDERFEQARADLEEAEQAHAALSNEVMPDDVRNKGRNPWPPCVRRRSCRKAGRADPSAVLSEARTKVRMKEEGPLCGSALRCFAAALRRSFQGVVPGRFARADLLIFAAFILKSLSLPRRRLLFKTAG